MRLPLLTSSFALAALSTGCLMDGAEPLRTSVDRTRTETPVASEDDVYRPITGALSGRISGDVGPLEGLDHQATALSAYDDGYYISIETIVEMQDRAVMTLLSVSRGTELFQPGTSGTYPLINDDNDMRVTLLGCVGQDVDVYDEWDKPADEVDIDVNAPENEEVPGTELDVDIVARWYDRDELGNKMDTFRSGATSLTLTR